MIITSEREGEISFHKKHDRKSMTKEAWQKKHGKKNVKEKALSKGKIMNLCKFNSRENKDKKLSIRM